MSEVALYLYRTLCFRRTAQTDSSLTRRPFLMLLFLVEEVKTFPSAETGAVYRGISLTRNRLLLGPYRRTVPS